MEQKPNHRRPTFDIALKTWKDLLQERGFPTDLLWVFDENLCFERAPQAPGGYALSFQTAFTPPPPQAEQLAYDIFCESNAPIVFYRVGSAAGKSVCVLLSDDWFQGRTVADGFTARAEWRILFHPGIARDLPEITDRDRWQKRILRDRPLHDLDFCMPLRAVHEYLAHGRVLTAYERYALRFLHAWKHFLRSEE